MRSEPEPEPEVDMGRPIGAKQVSDERRKMILDMNDIGVRQCDIARHYKMPRSTVCNIIRRGRVTKMTETRGRKSKLSERTQRIILRAAENNRFKPSYVHAREYNKFASIPVFTRTVRRCLHKNCIRNYTAASKPYLSPNHLSARKQWARNHIHWTNESWITVIFSDESTFTVRPTASRKKVWRKANTKFELRNLVPGFISICVCGAFSHYGRTPLIHINGTLKQDRYLGVLHNQVLPFGMHHYGFISKFVL